MWRLLFAAAALGAWLPSETLRSVGALPAHIAGRFQDIGACEQSADGSTFIFDRRSHAVFSVPPSRDSAREIIQIGVEPGRILRPYAFDLAADGTFVVADAPGNRGRLQFFLASGASVGGFSLPERELPLVVLDGTVLNGIGSLEYTGKTVLMSRPESGALVTEYGLDGRPMRTFGLLRATGQEKDREVHLALNAGLVLALPKGGFYYVFVAGVPAFRKYDAGGALLFERHIEGLELDDYVRTIPSAWPRRRTEDGVVLPFVRPAIRAAAVDAAGQLWLSLVAPYTYVYDSAGDKRRILELRGAGPLSPTSLAFTPQGRLLATPGCYEFEPK